MIKRYIYAKEDFKIVKVKTEINDKILKKLLLEIKTYYETIENADKQDNLHGILKSILECKDNLKLSYLVSKLLNFEFKTPQEETFLNQCLLCFHFSLVKGAFDLKRIILNCEYKLDISQADPYYIDENTISKKIDDLPFVKER